MLRRLGEYLKVSMARADRSGLVYWFLLTTTYHYAEWDRLAGINFNKSIDITISLFLFDIVIKVVKLKR